MTGYLQRLVTTAVRGTTGVRPIVRPAGNDATAEQPAWTELADETGPRRGEATDPDVSTAPPDPGGPVTNDDQPSPATGHNRDRMAAELPGVPEGTPLFGAMPVMGPAAPVTTEAGPAARPSVVRRSRPAPPADHPRGPTRERSDPAAPSSPDFQSAAAWAGLGTLPFGQESRPTAMPATSGAAGADRGDVEIHIGRIEVTAVPAAPAAPPVAKAARKSIKLSEYLRDGK